MKALARIILLMFAVVTVSGHAGAQSIVYHADAHHEADHHASGSAYAHVHDAGLVIAVTGDTAAPSSCPHDLCDPENDTSGAHFHILCCGAFMALLPSEIGIETLAVKAADLSIGRSSLALGELRYPLLRPPCQLV